MAFRPLRDFQVRQRILASDHQGYKDRLSATTPLSFSGNVEVHATPNQGMHVYVPPPSVRNIPEIRRVRVTTANVDTAPVLQLVKNLDNDDAVTGKAFPVVSLCKMAVDDEMYVVKPTNGITGTPMYSPGGSDPDVEVVWIDVRPAGAMYDFDLTASGGSSGANPADRTYTIKLHGGTTTISSSAQAPLVRFQAGRLGDATRGQGPIDEDGVPTLHIAYEGLYGAGDCGA